MFADSFTAMFFVVVSPQAWLALAAIVVVAVAAHRRAEAEERAPAAHSRSRWLLELAPLLIVPIGLLSAAQLSDPGIAGQRDMRTVAFVLVAAITLQVVLGSGLLWRHRHRWLPTLVIAGGLCWWTLGVGFMAYMALTDNWL
jgi:hypothetical protein